MNKRHKDLVKHDEYINNDKNHMHERSKPYDNKRQQPYNKTTTTIYKPTKQYKQRERNV